MGRPVRRRGHGPAGIVAVAALLLLGLASPPVLRGESSPAIGAIGRAVAPPSAGFAERAGFEGWHGADTLGAVPLARAQSVDVVFRPTNGSGALAGQNAPVPVSGYANSDGLSPEAYASAEAYFVGEGLTVVHAWPDRLALSLEGAPSALDRAFGTVLLAGTYHGRSAVYPATSPSLPSAIETEVAGVVGLSSGYETFSLAVTPTVLPASGVSAAGSRPAVGSSFTPGMARTLYGLSGLYNLTGGASYAAGESIALVLWGAGYAPSDISTFYADNYPSTFPAPTITPYPIDGAPLPSASALTASDELAVEEMTLDLEWSGSMAPGATLDAVYASAPSTVNLTDAFEEALSLPGVSAISMSFGAPESNSGSLASAWDPLFSEAAGRGITVLAATGDTGGDLNATCVGGVAPEFPASSPQVLAVGGTEVTIDRDGLGMITGFGETGWSLSGGGFSADFRAPGWQLVSSSKTAIEAAGGGRGTPDVSASAVNNFLYYDGADQEADGTSFATPLWAGLVAELDVHVGHPLGFFTDRLYHFIANETAGSPNDGVVDVQGGANCIATAGPGWDAVTGWGTPRAAPLNTQLAGSFVNITLSERPATVAPGGSMTLNVVLTNWSSGAPLTDAPVVLRLTGGSPAGPCAGAFESVTVASDSRGTASAHLSVPACYLGSHAVASASVETNRLYGHSSVRVAVNLLGFVPSLEWLGNAPYSFLLYAGIMAAAVGAGAYIGRRRPPAPSVAPPSVPALP
ncbi:MAG: S53 family peptidase, partial [Thermoplasmata archaeon]